jgi:hypothetical protein
MLNIKKTIFSFLFPQMIVSEIFLASVLLSIHSIFVFYKESDSEWLFPALPLYLIILALTAFLILHKNDEKFKMTKKIGLPIIQFLGLLFTTGISIFYLAEKLSLYDFSKFSFLDIFFLFYCFIVLIRAFIYYIIIALDRFSLIKRLISYIFKNMPNAKYGAFDISYTCLITLVCVIYYFYNSNNLYLSLGESFFAGVMLFDVFSFFKKDKNTQNNI